MWCTSVNTSLPRNTYFPPVGRPLACGLWMLWLWHSILFSWWVECSIALELERQDAKLKLFIFKTTMTDAASLLPLFLSPQLLPSIIKKVACHDQNSSFFFSSSSFVFLILLFPPLLSLESPLALRWQIHPWVSGKSTVTTLQLDKLATTCLWPPSNVLELLWMI